MTNVGPSVSCGAYSARAVTGETFAVSASVFREGHDAVACNVVLTRPGGDRSPFLRMKPGPDDTWSTPVTLDGEGLWSFTIEGWSDPLGTWWHDAPLKVDADVDTEIVLEQGARLYERALSGIPKAQQAVCATPPSAVRMPQVSPK